MSIGGPDHKSADLGTRASLAAVEAIVKKTVKSTIVPRPEMVS
jgi:hypothetical protein